ncbi:uncharacterized protein LOC127749534 [Frankliniella occidentalis]|uniref:Uncharacterized protein LOC127749534 n=1 Tax=Frankliniella occidentalis TaxID=133901 RepID=A0A9C6U6I2_FRAOC|nr:uncharacterized protein LOC127749534 [Frankliniella occidentalis]
MGELLPEHTSIAPPSFEERRFIRYLGFLPAAAGPTGSAGYIAWEQEIAEGGDDGRQPWFGTGSDDEAQGAFDWRGPPCPAEDKDVVVAASQSEDDEDVDVIARRWPGLCRGKFGFATTALTDGRVCLIKHFTRIQCAFGTINAPPTVSVIASR